MKKKIEYSHIARNKILAIHDDLTQKYGEEFAKKTISIIMKKLRHLEDHCQSGIRIAEWYDIDTDYYYVFVKRNYFIYRIDEDRVIIVQVFHEKQDFMQKLFGISGRTQESIDYWGE